MGDKYFYLAPVKITVLVIMALSLIFEEDGLSLCFFVYLKKEL